MSLAQRVATALRSLGTLVARPRSPALTAGIVAAVVVGVLAAGAGGALVVNRLTGLPDDAVYRLDGKILTRGEFDRRLHILTAVYGVREPEDPAALDGFRRDVAKALAVSDIVAAAARDEGVVVPDKVARDRLDEVIEQTAGGRAAFVAQLGSLGLSEADVLDEVRRTIVSARMFDTVTAHVAAPGDGEVQRYYQEHRAELAAPESRRLRNIVVADEDTAHGVLRDLRAGGDFAEVAARRSADQSTRDQGGDLGLVTADQLEEEYARVAFGAAQGELFGPVRTRHGWNVGLVVQVVPAAPRDLDEIRDQLRSELRLAEQLKVWRSWLAEKISAAAVEYADEFRPADPDAPPPDVGVR